MPNAKNEGLKYEMSYVNAGFNSGVELKPAKGGKAQLKITMYGGGNNKVMNIGPLPENITNLIKGYEISEDENTPEITEELQKYMEDEGWVFECYHPLEIRCNESFASDIAASIVVDYYRKELEIADGAWDD